MIDDLISIDKLVTKHIQENKSLREICRNFGISENNKGQLSKMLCDNGYEVRKGKTGLKVGDYIVEKCPICNKEKTIKLKKHNSKPRPCVGCATKKSHKDNPRIGREESHYNWKGGININAQGYIVEYVNKHNKFYPMATHSKNRHNGGYILQHRLVMAKYLGRCLKSNEIVHHINGIKTDNSINNLILIKREKHKNGYGNGYKQGYEDAMKMNGKRWDGSDWVVE